MTLRQGPRSRAAFGAWRALGLALAGLMMLASPPPALADPPIFAEVVADWLDDNESTALPALAELAASGDDRARLLLALIDKTPALQGPWLARLPRGTRIELMRASSGLSGRSWLQMADGLEVARHWQALLQVDAGLDTAAGLARLGETRAARAAVLMIAAREALELHEGWPDWLDPELAWAVWPGAGTDLRAQIAAMVPEDHPQQALMGQTLPDGALESWLSENPAAAPLRAVCDTYCSASGSACTVAAYRALGSHGALLTLGSPVETLIPEEDFLASPRGMRSVLRRIQLATDSRGRVNLLSQTRAADPCLGELLTEDNRRYRLIRDGAPLPSAADDN